MNELMVIPRTCNVFSTRGSSTTSPRCGRSQGTATINTQDDVRYKFVRFRDGTLLGLFDGRTATSRWIAFGYSQGKSSTDNGATWSKAEPLMRIPIKTGHMGHDRGVVDHDDELHAFFMVVGSGVQATGGEGERPLVGELSERVLISATSARQMDAPSGPSRAFCGSATPGAEFCHSNAQWTDRASVSLISPRNWGNRGEGLAAFTFVGQYNCTVIYSDDGGDTWQLGTDLTVPVPDIVSAYGAPWSRSLCSSRTAESGT